MSRRIAALATTTSSRPHSSIACSVRLAAPARVATNSVFATASPPACRISSTTDWANPGSLPPPNGCPPRSLTTIRAPRSASSSASQPPMPPPAPVTMMTSPSKLSLLLLPPITLRKAGPRHDCPEHSGRRLGHSTRSVTLSAMLSHTEAARSRCSLNGEGRWTRWRDRHDDRRVDAWRHSVRERQLGPRG